MDVRVVAALAAGAVAGVATWLILRAGEQDEARLARALDIARATRSPARRIDPLGPIGRALPDGLFMPLAWYPSADRGEERLRTMKGLAVLLALVFVALATQSVVLLLGVLAAPALGRVIVERYEHALRTRRQQLLEHEVTTALDILVLALEAGLPFDRALRAYADIVRSPLAAELEASVRELEVGYRRREALDRLAARTASGTLAQLASRVRLAEEFGTPLAQALRSLAVDLRATRRQRLQETALRAPVTMLLPTAAFILLPIFAIVLGPIALRVATGSLF